MFSGWNLRLKHNLVCVIFIDFFLFERLKVISGAFQLQFHFLPFFCPLIHLKNSKKIWNLQKSFRREKRNCGKKILYFQLHSLFGINMPHKKTEKIAYTHARSPRTQNESWKRKKDWLNSWATLPFFT